MRLTMSAARVWSLTILIADPREIRLRLPQSLALFLRPLAFGDVDRRANVFEEIAGRIANGMACRANVLNRSPWKNNSEIHVEVRALIGVFNKNVSAHPISIFWMNALVKRVVGRYTSFRIEAKQAIIFLRPVDTTSVGNVPRPAPGPRQPLRFR